MRGVNFDYIKLTVGVMYSRVIINQSTIIEYSIRKINKTQRSNCIP